MTAKKKISQEPAGKNDGNVSQIHAGSNAISKKNAVKYTLWRKKEDIAKIEELRDHLQKKYFGISFNTDSEIYKKLPDLYLNAVKRNHELINQVDDLTAKLDELEDLRSSFCRIFELCEVKK